MSLIIFIFMCFTVVIQAEMEPFILGGSFADIKKFSHASFLAIKCVIQSGRSSSWGCGSSIINQRILLTAAHCVFDCISNTVIIIRMGNEDKDNSTLRTSSGYIFHGNYDDQNVQCDIALVRMSRPVRFSPRISRVAIMKTPPYKEQGYVTGWGETDINTGTPSQLLKQLDQKVWKNVLCRETFKTIPKGTICASSENSDEFVGRGDSGSALTVRGYIQIGIVSYKISGKSRHVVVYTDVGYFYEWIAYNAQQLYCFIEPYKRL